MKRRYTGTYPSNINEKVYLTEIVFSEHKDTPFTWKDIKKIEFQDDDEISIHYEEPYYSENNSWDGHYVAQVERKVLETDEEFNRRIERLKNDKKELKKRRYENYLELKEEFTPIFTTYDGIEIFKGDKYFTLNITETKVPLFSIAGPYINPEAHNPTGDILYFSTWKAASEFATSKTAMDEVEKLLIERIKK